MVNMEETKPVQVMIVGAGLGGVMLAILLERLNIPYLVFERSSEVRPLGKEHAGTQVGAFISEYRSEH